MWRRPFMQKCVKPAVINGTITAPSSKSEMQRAVAAAYLTRQTCTIRNPSFCDDAHAALRIIHTLGATVTMTPGQIEIAPGPPADTLRLDCGEAGLCLRMFAAIAALGAREVTLIGQGGLQQRPIGMLEQPLRDLGVTCRTANGFLPLTLTGPLRAGVTTVDASITSQFLTGLLMALPLCDGVSEIFVPQLKSKPYIDMTLALLRAFGIQLEHEEFRRFRITGPQLYQPVTYNVEGDWSGAAFLLVAGAIAGAARVENLDAQSLQADRAILDALHRAGAQVSIGKNFVKAQQAELRGFDFDATDCPDLFPPLVALASCCRGVSTFLGATRLRHKESDRAAALRTEFGKLGIAVSVDGDRLTVTGGAIQGGDVASHHDHRIAMACAVVSLRSRTGVTIHDAECVAKSYPAFFDDLETFLIARTA